jgi:hypothetical protein
MKILILFIITHSVLASTAQEVEDAKKSLATLIQPLLNKNYNSTNKGFKDFSLQNCDKHKINWMNVALQKEEAKLTYVFKPGCDVEGTIGPKIFLPFSVQLKLRNLHSYHKITSDNKITASFETKPILHLDITSGVLEGPKGEVTFTADYEVQLNPMNEKNPIEKNLGGNLTIHKIYGKNVNIKEKILVK